MVRVKVVKCKLCHTYCLMWACPFHQNPETCQFKVEEEWEMQYRYTNNETINETKGA